MHDDCVLLKAPDPANYQDWMAGCKGNKTQVEGMLNHIHIRSLFNYSEFEPTREVILHIGRLLCDMCTCKLGRDFPNRKFKVEFLQVDRLPC